MEIFSSAVLFKNALSQSNHQLPWESYQHLHVYNIKHVFHTGEDKKPFKIEPSVNYLVKAIRMT